jgi:hypothetical protein
MTRFAALKRQQRDVTAAPPLAEPSQATPSRVRKPREGKRLVGGYFSPELSRAMNMLSAEQGISIQALLGEAIDDLMRKHGKHPFGER